MFLRRFIQHRGITSVVWLLSVILILEPCTFVQGQVKDYCTGQLKKARMMLDNGRFDESIAVINRCLAQPELSPATKLQAFELLAQNYFAKSSLARSYSEQITAAIKEMLKIDPNYKASPDNPSFAAEVQRVKDQMPKPVPPTVPVSLAVPRDSVAEESSFLPTWAWVGGGAVVLGGVALLLLKGGGGGGGGGGDGHVVPAELPDPPNRPKK